MEIPKDTKDLSNGYWRIIAEALIGTLSAGF